MRQYYTHSVVQMTFINHFQLFIKKITEDHYQKPTSRRIIISPWVLRYWWLDDSKGLSRL